MCSKCPKSYNTGGNKALNLIGLALGVQTYKDCDCQCTGTDLQVSNVGQQNMPRERQQTGNTGSTINTVAYCSKCQHSFLLQTMNIS